MNLPSNELCRVSGVRCGMQVLLFKQLSPVIWTKSMHRCSKKHMTSPRLHRFWFRCHNPLKHVVESPSTWHSQWTHQLSLQVRDNPSGNFSKMYRHISKGSWTFSMQDQGWQVSDCTAEGLKVTWSKQVQVYYKPWPYHANLGFSFLKFGFWFLPGHTTALPNVTRFSWREIGDRTLLWRCKRHSFPPGKQIYNFLQLCFVSLT